MIKNRAFLLVVVVLLVALGYWLMGKEGRFAGDMSPSSSPSSSPAPKAQAGGAKDSPAAPSKSYTELVSEYDGRRIQFDQNCQAIPNGVTFKEGTSIMLDNRSGDPRTIKVGDKSFDLQGYGYWITTLSSPTLPQELFVSCGSAVNVGKILLQAKLY